MLPCVMTSTALDEDGTSDAPVRMTLEEWAALPEDEPGELIDGVLVEEEMPSYLHEFVIAWLVRILGTWASGRRAWVASSGGKFAVQQTRGRMPDVTVYLPGVKRPPAEGLIRVPPSIAIEVVSPTPRDARRDRVEKLSEYAAFGVTWYWLVDPALETFEILELAPDGHYMHVVAVTGGVIDPVPGCDGLSIDVAALWAEVAEVRAAGEGNPE